MTDYRPIDCAIYSRYEVAILHQTPLRVHWQDPDGQAHLATLVPTDLETRDGEEFLHARTVTGDDLSLRLDRIQCAEPLEGTEARAPTAS